MLEIPATHNSVLNEPAQPHQQQSIIVEESSKKLEFGIAAHFLLCLTVFLLVVA
jgi:hypothetical protein